MVCRDLQFGIGTHAIQLTKHLRRLGINVDLYIGRGNFKTNLLPLRLKKQYDVIHVQGSPFGAFETKTPRVTTVHTTLRAELCFEFNLSYFFGRFFEIPTLSRSDAVIIVNEDLREDVQLLTHPENIVYIPNAIDTEEFDVEDEHERNPMFVMGCGRNIRRKDFPTLIAACKKANVPCRVFHGELHRQELIKAYKSASIFVCSSLYETGPLTVLEAMAAKCPVICSSIPEVKDLVIDGKTGLLFKPGDADDLAWNIQFLLRYPERKHEMIENAYEHVKNNFNWENAVKETIRVYEEIKK